MFQSLLVMGLLVHLLPHTLLGFRFDRLLLGHVKRLSGWESLEGPRQHWLRLTHIGLQYMSHKICQDYRLRILAQNQQGFFAQSQTNNSLIEVSKPPILTCQQIIHKFIEANGLDVKEVTLLGYRNLMGAAGVVVECTVYLRVEGEIPHCKWLGDEDWKDEEMSKYISKVRAGKVYPLDLLLTREADPVK